VQGLERGRGGRRTTGTNHTDIPKELPAIAAQVDRPRRGAPCKTSTTAGCSPDTLVVWSTEFGRQPFTQGATGRDHNAGTSVAVARRGPG